MEGSWDYLSCLFDKSVDSTKQGKSMKLHKYTVDFNALMGNLKV